MIRKVITIAVLSMMVLSCKSDKKTSNSETEQKTNSVQEQQKVTEQPKLVTLPKDVVQLNDAEIEGIGINITKVQIQNTEEDKFVYKIFVKSDIVDLYKNGDYSIFIQNFPYDSDLYLLEEKFKGAKLESYWVNLKNLKPHKDEYVIFRSFESKIYDYAKIVVGIMNLKDKSDIIRTEFLAPSILK